MIDPNWNFWQNVEVRHIPLNRLYAVANNRQIVLEHATPYVTKHGIELVDGHGIITLPFDTPTNGRRAIVDGLEKWYLYFNVAQEEQTDAL